MSLGVEYIRTTFNMNTKYKVHVIAIEKPTTLLLSTFFIHLTKCLHPTLTFCPLIIVDNFNVNMSHQNLTRTNEHQKSMNENLLYLEFTKAITIYNSQLATYQQCLARVVEALLD
jgi:hypothetical protein